MLVRTKRPRWTLGVLLGATIAAASVVGVAGADDISNSVETVAEVMPLTAGGPSGTTDLYVLPKNGDGKNGCNFQGNTETLGLSVSSSNTAVATVSPSSLTFTSCGDIKTLTVTPHNQGSATISVSQTSNNTGATFNLAPATFTVNVAPPPNTPPTVTVAGVTGGASYNKGSVPAATCQVTDAEDGNSSFAATLSAVSGPYASDGIGAQTASCSYTDGGGLTVSASETYGIVDPTPPAISSVLNPLTPDGANGWYTSDVALDWTVAEPESPNSLLKTGCVDQDITADQAATVYSCEATSAGGSAGPVTVTIKRDATAPTNVQFNADVAADGGRYFPTTVPTGTGCTADDATSGLASCVVTGRSTAVGTHTLTATATDNAGNTATATRTYSVRVLTVSGFFQPVDMGGMVNTVKGGSTVPLKFTVWDEGVEQTATSVVKSFVQRTVTCGTLSGATDEIEIVTTGGTSLRYDTTARQFIQNWQTPKKPGTCMQATVTMIDGTAITANFQLK
jgi:hypothetical protein